MSAERYSATVHETAKSAYLERLKNAEQKLSIYEIGGRYIVAASLYSAHLAFAEAHKIRKLSNDDLKELNRTLLFELTDAK